MKDKLKTVQRSPLDENAVIGPNGIQPKNRKYQFSG